MKMKSTMSLIDDTIINTCRLTSFPLWRLGEFLRSRYVRTPQKRAYLRLVSFKRALVSDVDPGKHADLYPEPSYPEVRTTISEKIPPKSEKNSVKIKKIPPNFLPPPPPSQMNQFSCQLRIISFSCLSIMLLSSIQTRERYDVYVTVFIETWFLLKLQRLKTRWRGWRASVSYTHLTLPTIYSV